MRDVVHKVQRIVTADRARCRLDRIDTTSGAPLALTDQRGHHALRAEVRCGQQERHAKTTSASVRNRASPVAGTAGATGRWSSGADRA